MGQAKLRGPKELRVAEGIVKEQARKVEAKRRRAEWLASLTPKEKKALAEIRTFMAFAGM